MCSGFIELSEHIALSEGSRTFLFIILSLRAWPLLWDQESWDGCHTSGGSLYSWLILLRLIPEIYKRTSEDVLTFSWLIQAILDPLLPEVLLWSTPTLCCWKNSHKAPKQNIWKWITEGVFVLFSENRLVCMFFLPSPPYPAPTATESKEMENM